MRSPALKPDDEPATRIWFDQFVLNDTRRELDRLESKYQTWRRAEIGRRFLALDTAAREGLLLQAREDIRTRPDGGNFRSLPREVQQRMAELKVRGHLGRDLPSLEEWAARSAQDQTNGAIS
jgi:hypothetical protein